MNTFLYLFKLFLTVTCIAIFPLDGTPLAVFIGICFVFMLLSTYLYMGTLNE